MLWIREKFLTPAWNRTLYGPDHSLVTILICYWRIIPVRLKCWVSLTHWNSVICQKSGIVFRVWSSWCFWEGCGICNLLVIRCASNLFGVKCCVWCLHVSCKGKIIMNPAVVLSSFVCAGCVGISGSWHSNLPHLHHQSPWWAKAWTDTNIPIFVSIHCLIIWFWPRSVFIYHMTKQFMDEAFCISSVII